MIGLWANVLAVVLGGLIGSLLKGGIPERFSRSINRGLALCVLLIGISGAIKTENMIIVIVSIVIGTVLGELLRLEDRLDQLGVWAQKRLAKNDDGFSKGFINATLLFCIGSMAVVGSLEAGIQNKPDTLLAKAMIDGVTAIIFASTWGLGVALSAAPILVYQGGITLAAMLVGRFLGDAAVRELSATGSLLIIGLGFNMLDLMDERIRVGNMLPSLAVAAIAATIF